MKTPRASRSSDKTPNRTAWIFIATAAVLLLFLLSCKPKNGASPAAGAAPPGGAPPPTEVSIVEVTKESVPVTNELPGRISARRIAEVRARATGILLKRLFTEGADVKEGDVLFEIDPAPLQASLDSAEANFAKAEASKKIAEVSANRLKSLVNMKAVSTQEYDNAAASLEQSKAEVLAAQAAVETAKLNLGYTKVTAPISGRIGKALVTEGALVSATEATQMAVIQQLDPIYFDFVQSSTEIMKIRQSLNSGQLESIAGDKAKVKLLLEDDVTYPEEGRLLFSDITVDQTTGMVTMRTEFPNPDKMLLPGMFARARLEQAVNNEALTLPQRTVARNGNGTGTVMVVTSDNKVEARIVKAEVAVGDKWIIIDGVKAGERVIIEGLQKVRPGAVVKPVPYNSNIVEAKPLPAVSMNH